MVAFGLPVAVRIAAFAVPPVIAAAVQIAAHLRHSDVVFVGPRRSGKTTLSSVLGSKEPIDASLYRPTQASARRPMDTSRLEGKRMRDLALKPLNVDLVDMPGGTIENLAAWSEAVKMSRVVCFMADLRMLMSDPAYVEVVIRSADQVGSWLEAGHGIRTPHPILILSHVDVTPGDPLEILRSEAVARLKRALRIRGASVIAADVRDPQQASAVGLEIWSHR